MNKKINVIIDTGVLGPYLSFSIKKNLILTSKFLVID
jgi:hypothetical protein